MTTDVGLRLRDFPPAGPVSALDKLYFDQNGEVYATAQQVVDFATLSTGLVRSSIAALRAVDHTKAMQVFVTDYYGTGGGKGGGAYSLYATSAPGGTENGGTDIVATDGAWWKLIHNGEVSLDQFGARLDNATLDDGAWTNIVAALNTGRISSIRVPMGISLISSTYTITASGGAIKFASVDDGCRVQQTANVDSFIFTSSTPATANISGWTLQNFTVWQQPAPTAGRALTLIKATRFKFTNLDLRNCFNGLDIQGGNGIFIDGVEITSGYGWTAQMPGSWLVRFTASQYPGPEGAHDIPGEIFISNYNIKGNTGTVLGAPDNTLQYAIVTQAQDGVWFSNGHCGFAYGGDLFINPQAVAGTWIVDLEFDNGYFDGSFGTGFGVVSGGSSIPTVSGIRFNNCLSKNHSGHGISLNPAIQISDFQWRGGSITSNGGYGIIGENLVDPIIDTYIEGNNTANTASDGVFLTQVTRGRVACSVVSGTTPHAHGINIGPNCAGTVVQCMPMSGNTVDYVVDGTSTPLFEGDILPVAPNLVRAGPSSGGSAQPSYRALVLSDLPGPYSSSTLPIANGGTGATSASAARTALGLGSVATQAANAIALTGGSVDGIAVGGATPAAGTFTALKGNSLSKLTYTNVSAQSIPNTTSTIVTGWTSTFDQNSNFNASTGVFTAPSAGFYKVTAFLQFNGTFSAGSNVGVKIARNGTTTYAGSVSIGVSTINPQGMVSALLQLAANDAVTVLVSQTSGGALPLSTSAALNFLSIEQLP